MSTIDGRRALPRPAILALSLAVLLLWIGVLLIALALLPGARSGLLLGNWFSIPAGLGDTDMATAIRLQWILNGLTLALIWGLGSIIVLVHMSGRAERAADIAMWLLRVLMVVTVVAPVVAIGPILAIRGTGLPALIALAPSLPQMLVSLAFLICAAAYLRRGPESVF